VLCAHHGSCDLPFSTRDGICIEILSLARLFDSLVRVTRRVKAPHFQRQVLSITEKNQLAATNGLVRLKSPASSTLLPLALPEPLFCTCLRSAVSSSPHRRMLRWSALAESEMEMRPLSLSRLQVLCHSLSKVLFKLSLTLLVRYRSSYFVFNFGRHIPAASHCTPKQCYSLVTVDEAPVSGSTG